MLIKLRRRVGNALQRRTAPSRTNEYRVSTVPEQWAQRAVLDVIEGCFAAADVVTFRLKRIFEPLNALRRVVGENPADGSRIVEIDQQAAASLPLAGVCGFSANCLR